MARAAVRQAEANLLVRRSEQASAEARLIQPSGSQIATSGDCCLQVRAPADGVVLKVHAESAQVVAAGAEIAEIGDPKDMEVMVDLLSADAVQVQPEAVARIEGWGGGEASSARVRRVDPSAFTKVSALGIEEQRVNVKSGPARPLCRLGAARPRVPRFRPHPHLAWRGCRAGPARPRSSGAAPSGQSFASLTTRWTCTASVERH